MARRRSNHPNRSVSWRYVVLHPALWFVLATGVMIFGAIQLWHTHYHTLIDLPEYQLTEQRIQLNQPPPWVDVDLKTAILEQLQQAPSLLDNQLVPLTADMCNALPWIEKIGRIEKVTAGLDVELQYRQPVGLVEISTQSGAQVIDRQAVLMDSRTLDYTPVDTLMRISVARPMLPQQTVWTAWQDHRIVDAAKICSIENVDWEKLGCFRVVSWDRPGSQSNKNPFEIWPRTAKGLKIVWGSAPGDEKKGEASPSEKLAAIEQYIADARPSDEQNSGTKIDVRTGVAVLVDDVQTAKIPDFSDRLKSL